MATVPEMLSAPYVQNDQMAPTEKPGFPASLSDIVA